MMTYSYMKGLNNVTECKRMIIAFLWDDSKNIICLSFYL